jgi:rare lipoprotein A (peptidoglycan hydrolase)
MAQPRDHLSVECSEKTEAPENDATQMICSRHLLVVLAIGGAMLPLVLPGCALPIGRKETPPPPVVVSPVKEQVPNAEAPKVEQVGNASWYGPAHDGKETASGETFDQNELTAAHPTLPMGTKAVVTNLGNGKSVTVTINDRGPYVKGRKIDLSRAAARKIGMSKKGVAKVKIESRLPPARDQEADDEAPRSARGNDEH